MRKVLFKKWIPTVKVNDGKVWVTQEGTGKWEKDFTHKGVFHQWASAFEEFESGAGNYTVALVELENGEIEQVLPMNIKFIDK